MIYDDFFLLINIFSNFTSILFLFFFQFYFYLILFYLNPKLLRMEEEIKGDGGRPQPVLPLIGLSGIFISNLKSMA